MRSSHDPLSRLGLALTVAALGLGTATAAPAEPAESDMDGLPACAYGGTVGTPRPAPVPQARTTPNGNTDLADTGANIAGSAIVGTLALLAGADAVLVTSGR